MAYRTPQSTQDKTAFYCKLYDAAKTRRSTFDQLYQEISDFLVPWRNDVISPATPGTKLTNRIFSSKGPNALTIAASAAHGTLTPGTVKWFGLDLDAPELDDNIEVQEWLETCRDDMLRAINASNFDAEGQETVTDLFGYGTGCMFIEEDQDTPGDIICTSMQPGLYTVAENKYGLVDTIYRMVRTLSVRAAADMFGPEKLSEKSRQMLGTDKEETLLEILHAVCPRADVDPTAVQPETPADQLPWASMYIEYQSKTLLRESGFHEFPAVVPRFWKIAGEVYGRGPGMVALPDVRTLNRLVELRLKAQALTVNPPLLQRDKGIIGETRLIPLAKIITRDMDALKPLDLRINFQGIELDMTRLEASVDRIFYIDQIQFAPMGSTPLTATEASLRFEMMQRILGPALSRTLNEYVSPMLNRVFRIRLRAGKFPQVPEQVFAATGGQQARLNVKYTGPLARAQMSSEVDSVQKFYGIAGPIAAQFPEVMRPVKHADVGTFLANATGLPASVLKTEDEMAAEQEAEGQIVADAQNQQSTALVAESLGKVAPYIEATQGS